FDALVAAFPNTSEVKKHSLRGLQKYMFETQLTQCWL
ncbi:hypothetical protein A2U01_0003170, partial [Trifolium medium]|nr:hypothetical protein [Trifolium medium]